MKTSSEMYYRVQVMISGKTVTESSDLLPVAKVLEGLLGRAQIAEGVVIGQIEAEDYDLELIHKTIEENTSVDVRIGVARSDFLASIALVWSDRSGVTFISADEEDTYLAGIPVAEVQGVSAITARRMRKLQIYTAYDIKYSSREFLLMNFDSSVMGIYSALVAVCSPRQIHSWYKQISVSAISINDSMTKPIKNKKEEAVLVTENGIGSAVLNLFNYNIGTISAV